MTKLFCLLFLFIFATWSNSALSAPMGSQKVSAKDLAQVEAEAKRAAQEQKKIDEQAKKVKTELAGLNQKMIAAAKKIQNGEDEVRQKTEDLEALQKHLQKSEAKFEAEHGMLVETLGALQNLALRPSEAVLVQPLSPVEVMRSSILLRGSVHALKDRAETIRESIEDINNQKSEIAQRLQDLEKENAVLAAQQEEMKDLHKQKSQIYSQLSSQSKDAEEKAKVLASQAGNLRDLLDKLEKQKQAQRQMAEKERLARAKAVENLRKSNNHSYDLGEYKEVNVGFSKAKGKLSRPARGTLITKFHQEMSKGVVSNGIDIKTASKAQIIAPYDGTVIFSGPFKNFANLLIIDHGEGYTSLLSGLGETDAKVGQTLLAGEPVGTMPSGSNAKLHMEIRKNNHPVDPNEWMVKN